VFISAQQKLIRIIKLNTSFKRKQ